jgi:hypothetical protein
MHVDLFHCIIGQNSTPIHTMKHLSQRVLDNLRRHLQEGSPTNKGWGRLSAIPLKTLNLKLKIQEETDG